MTTDRRHEYVVGIDPSSSISSTENCIGFSVFRDGQLIETGEIIPDPLMGFTRVRRWIHDKIRAIHIKDPSPKITVACETAYYGKNVSVFMGLIRVKAHIEAAVLDEACSYREVSPMVSFQASTGLKQYPLNSKGKRDGTRKPAIQAAVKARYHLSEDTSEHCCDAIAISEAIIARS